MKKMTDRIAEERNKKGITQQHTEYISSIIHDWDNTEDRNRKMVLQMLFDKIEYNCITKEFTLYGAEYITNKN